MITVMEVKRTYIIDKAGQLQTLYELVNGTFVIGEAVQKVSCNDISKLMCFVREVETVVQKLEAY